MSNNEKPLTSVDAIRCVWLARTAAARGDHEACRRWQTKVDGWLRRQSIADPPSDQSHHPE